ncbi:MAG: methionine biosynthesis protein MetW [Alphaproteobacteria bacterium]|nr:methionine biosynthesis protein MetW [Alphaproteobacteria bacterium]MBL6937466.1 methionine biosynthesis protein MetW [Alphaproteobacteria bacterium]MBL7098804.1 methionine biosynthesis protein MetW [Alphaproteobacteria bacterium]
MSLRPDLAAIAEMIPRGSRVLDVGCGDGALLEHLIRTKAVDGRGIELSQQNVNACVARGLSVMQGDADTDLNDYPSAAFDVTILSQTIQATFAPKDVLNHLLRIGRRTVISLPNFGHWSVRLSLLVQGRMPRTKSLEFDWYDTPNIHLCTISDFVSMARSTGAAIERALALDENGATREMQAEAWGPNLLANGAIFLLKRKTADGDRTTRPPSGLNA